MTLCKLVRLRGISTQIDGELMTENYKVNMWNCSHTVVLPAEDPLQPTSSAPNTQAQFSDYLLSMVHPSGGGRDKNRVNIY